MGDFMGQHVAFGHRAADLYNGERGGVDHASAYHSGSVERNYFGFLFQRERDDADSDGGEPDDHPVGRHTAFLFEPLRRYFMVSGAVDGVD